MHKPMYDTWHMHMSRQEQVSTVRKKIIWIIVEHNDCSFLQWGHPQVNHFIFGFSIQKISSYWAIGTPPWLRKPPYQHAGFFGSQAIRIHDWWQLGSATNTSHVENLAASLAVSMSNLRSVESVGNQICSSPRSSRKFLFNKNGLEGINIKISN